MPIAYAPRRPPGDEPDRRAQAQPRRGGDAERTDSSLIEIAHVTRLSRPAVCWILLTLQHLGYVEPTMSEGRERGLIVVSAPIRDHTGKVVAAQISAELGGRRVFTAPRC